MSSKMPNALRAKTASALKRAAEYLAGLSALAVLAYGLALGAAGVLLYLYSSVNQAPSQQDCAVNSQLRTTGLRVGDQVFTAEVAEERPQQAQGLSGRNCLGKDRAMLFVYDRPGDYCFWMKDMRFPIDIVWLDEKKRITTIAANVNPDTYPHVFCPETPANYVVEVAAGIANAHNWQSGAQFEF
jgi:uncharacterized protein